MIDAAATLILMKAIDFVFEDGKKILEEHMRLTNNGQDVKNSLDVPANLDIIRSKEVALSSVAVIEKALFGESELQEMNHLLSLLDIYKKNYYLAKEQLALHGSAYVPPVIVHNLAVAEAGVVKTTQDLQKLLSRIYGKEVIMIENV
jgi:hypothetical protein